MAKAKEFLDSILVFYIDENIPIPRPEKIVEFQKSIDKQFTSFVQSDPSADIQKKTVRKM